MLDQGVYGVFERERRIYEFYDPDVLHTQALRRKHGNWWKALTLGRGPQREFVGWTGLVNNLLLEVLLGLELGPTRWSLCPRLPPACRGMRLEIDVPILGTLPTALAPGPGQQEQLNSTGLPAHRLQLQLRIRDQDRFEGSVCHQGAVACFHTGFAERVLLAPLLQKAQPCATAI
ncbi:hypothetical protein U5801_20210 [Lamprobacter modestohalophilus]|nr:hypothetical protein [Lamprobacter modestohalophilus]